MSSPFKQGNRGTEIVRSSLSTQRDQTSDILPSRVFIHHAVRFRQQLQEPPPSEPHSSSVA